MVIGFYMKRTRQVLYFSKRKSTIQHGIKKNYRVTMREKSNFKDDKLIIVYKKEQLF